MSALPHVKTAPVVASALSPARVRLGVAAGGLSVVLLLAACGKSEAPKTEAPAPAPVAAAPAPVAAADGGKGADIFKKTCAMCHQTGVAGAPKFGDKAAWAPYVATGIDTMLKVAISGKGAMPPRGASTATDDELRAAIQYMVDHAK